MIDKSQTVLNNNVAVCYSFVTQSVYVLNKANNATKVFGGWDELCDQFNAFWNSFSEQTTFADACNYFKPSIGNTSIQL